MGNDINVIGLNDLTVTVGVIVAIAALIATLWNAIKAIREMTQPAKDLVSRVDKLEVQQAKNMERLDEQEEGQKLLLRSMLVILEYDVSGGHADKETLTLLKTDITNYLIKNR